MKNTEWNKLSASILKAELKRRDINYERLVSLLAAINIHETHGSILSKMSRGSFTFSFFLQCAAAIGITTIRFDEIVKEQQLTIQTGFLNL